MPLMRDPISVQFDPAAARLLRRCYRNPGQWQGTYLRNPSGQWELWARRNGVRLLGPDNAGGGQARTRWARAFVRSAYYLHKWYYYETAGGLVLSDRRAVPATSKALVFEVGTVRIAQTGLVLGRSVRLKVVPGGRAAIEAVDRLPGSRRIYTPHGYEGGAHSDLRDRDWLPGRTLHNVRPGLAATARLFPGDVSAFRWRACSPQSLFSASCFRRAFPAMLLCCCQSSQAAQSRPGYRATGRSLLFRARPAAPTTVRCFPQREPPRCNDGTMILNIRAAVVVVAGG